MSAPGFRRRGWALASVAALALAGCDFLDPTDVDNPATTDEDLAAAREPTRALLPGLRAQFARALNTTIPEVVSDNYSIHGTGINKVNDFPRQITPDLIGGTYTLAQELRALADFVLDEIIPNDPGATAEQHQEAQYYRGMALLLLGEWFAAAPTAVDGAAVPAAQLVSNAITEFEAARAAAPDGDFDLPAAAALARAYRMAGNAAQAEALASEVLTANAEFLFDQGFDASTVQNIPFLFVVLRALQEMQPHPRLDFLDPKYTTRASPIPVSKAEELHLILAEVHFSRGEWAQGKERIAQAIEVVQMRPRLSFADEDQRLNEDLSIRPNDASIDVRADGSSPFRSGLVLTRGAETPAINTPIVSGTSLDADSIRAIPDADTESLLHAMFLARQEMLVLEGRRMTDLGIRLPIALTEIETNPNINQGDLGTLVIVPSYIPPGDDMDLFTPMTPYDMSQDPPVLIETQITARVDMNRVLAQNKVSPFGLP